MENKTMNAKLDVARTIALLAVLLVPRAAAPHHSFAAQYDGSKAIRLTGTLVKVEWTNPHTYFYIDVMQPDGSLVRCGSRPDRPARCRGAASSAATSSWATRSSSMATAPATDPISPMRAG